MSGRGGGKTYMQPQELTWLSTTSQASWRQGTVPLGTKKG